jgi:hypothetical protein
MAVVLKTHCAPKDYKELQMREGFPKEFLSAVFDARANASFWWLGKRESFAAALRDAKNGSGRFPRISSGTIFVPSIREEGNCFSVLGKGWDHLSHCKSFKQLPGFRS